MLLVVSCLAFSQNIIKDYAPHTKRGELPPAWLRNKVTESQYDSLATLSKHYAVNYNYFKRRNLTKEDIQRYVGRTKVMLSDKQLRTLKEQGKDTCTFDVYSATVAVHPFALPSTETGTANDVKFIVYSEIDGYDAHVMLEAKQSKTADGKTVFSEMRLIPYSLSGLKTELVGTTLHCLESTANEVRQCTLNKAGESPTYRVLGLLKVEDAMGYIHTELINKDFFLKLDK